MRILFPLLAIALSGCAASAETHRGASDQDKLTAELAGLTPQKPVSCIDDYRSGSISAYGPTILYKIGRGLIYRSDTTGGCENIARGDILVTHSISGGRLCQGDIAQTVDSSSHMMTGSCSFAAFTPYRKTP
ncbi:MAG: hypothetical protein JWN66_4536 [Sphingomonas bacterium]|nr:hypothetical protein [Sphingomonas bacterium]